MAEELYYRRHVSQQHLEVLVQYMERYSTLALASARSREGLIQSKRMWEKIARTLNRIDERVTKSGKNWARYWIDLKFKIRRKYTNLRKCQAEGAPCKVQLNPFEKRIVLILTDENGQLLPTASVYQHIAGLKNGHLTCDRRICSEAARIAARDRSSDEEEPDDSHAHDNCNRPDNEDRRQTEQVNVEERDEKPNITNLGGDVTDPIEIEPSGEKTVEELKRELLQFEANKQKELYDMEKEHRKEKHELELSILTLKKQLVMKQLRNY